MKVVRDNFDNLEKIEAQAVTNPVMADAVQFSKDRAKQAGEVIKNQEEPFTSGDKQPQPEKVEVPKMTLEESLFEELNHGFHIEAYVNGKPVEKIIIAPSEEVAKKKFIKNLKGIFTNAPEVKGFSINVIDDKNYADAVKQMKARNRQAEVEALEDDNTHIRTIVSSLAKKLAFNGALTDEEEQVLKAVKEACKSCDLKEADGRQNSALKDLDDTDDPEEEMSIWTRVYAELIRNSADAAWYASQHKKVPSKTSARYDHVDPVNDSDLKVYADDDALMEEDGILLVNPEGRLAHAQKVADAYGLTYKVGRVNKTQAQPGETTYMIIRIPEPDKIVEGINRVFRTIDNAVDNVGEVVKTAVGPDGAVSNLTKDPAALAGGIATVAPLFADAESEAEQMNDEEIEQEVEDELEEGILDTVKDKLANVDDALTAVNNANADDKLSAGAEKFVNGVNKVGNGILKGLDALGTINKAVGGKAHLSNIDFNSIKNQKTSDMLKNMSKDDIEELKKALADKK